MSAAPSGGDASSSGGWSRVASVCLLAAREASEFSSEPAVSAMEPQPEPNVTASEAASHEAAPSQPQAAPVDAAMPPVDAEMPPVEAEDEAALVDEVFVEASSQMAEDETPGEAAPRQPQAAPVEAEVLEPDVTMLEHVDLAAAMREMQSAVAKLDSEQVQTMETQTLSDDELALQTKQTALAGWLDARPATGGLPDTHHSAPASLQALAVEPFQGAQSELVGYAPVPVTYADCGPVLGPRAVADARLQVLDDVDPEMRDEAAAAAKPASPRGDGG